MHFSKIFGVLCLGLIAVCNAAIERVDDSDLIHILTGKGDVVALFTKTGCAACVEYENVVGKIQSELRQTLGATVVQAHNSNLIHIYDPSREPALLYFRRGIPILYHGAVNEEEIVQFFGENREPGVKELSDDNFEHLTQASTGATTGDWFIFFYSAECVLCQRLYAVWEAVGGTLRRKINVARMNSLTAGMGTAQRLKIAEAPEFVFLRLGKLYRYPLKDYTPKAFIEFVEDGYLRNTQPEDVPKPSSLIDELSFEHLMDYIRNSGTLPLAVVGTFAVLFLFYVVKSLFKPSEKKKNITKKDK
ncbi:thioredoxin domain-containing protein [Drosophila grimshawi]|uniref:GH13139 n=1 Tax=Drosophila grimshawi TaxID=7222 RepID=B4JQQ5_DROGR|nr:thioredoxin domain-containing protein [Drosophila grimshawi]EDV99235.1 GH13139 [Drosophila grimshawi]